MRLIFGVYVHLIWVNIVPFKYVIHHCLYIIEKPILLALHDKSKNIIEIIDTSLVIYN